MVGRNLSPGWVERLIAEGWMADHWSALGDPRAPDAEVLASCRERDSWLLTADLDFGAILAARTSERPSVIQLRLQDPTPDAAAGLVVELVRRFQSELELGALLSIDESGGRARLLPLRP